MKFPETWPELKAELEAAGVPETGLHLALMGWALAERAAPATDRAMQTDRADWIWYRAQVESVAGSCVERIEAWKRRRVGA